jgi:hypothetical protein
MTRTYRPDVQDFSAAMTCLKPAPWTAYPGVCTLPKIGHGKRCRFEAAEFLTVRP